MSRRSLVACCVCLIVALPMCVASRTAFYSDSTRLSVGASRVISFRVDRAPASNAVLSLRVKPEDALEVLSPPMVMAGYTNGFMQVRARRTGRGSLDLGGSRLKFVIESGRASDGLGVRPAQFVTPPPGAVVWGKFAAGIEWFGPPGETDGGEVLVVVRGQEVKPVRILPGDGGLHRRFVFEFDADTWPEGAVRLVPKSRQAGGLWAQGAALELNVYRATRLEIAKGECEAPPPLESPRPERFGVKAPAIVKDGSRSGGAIVRNNSGRPAVLAPVSAPGRYQLMLTAAGVYAGGALPSVALTTESGDRAIARGRLADTEWRRTPIGKPGLVTQGVHVVAFEFDNDFYLAGAGDRDLLLDCYELARLPDPSDAKAGDDDAMMATMSGGAMMMNAGTSAATGGSAAADLSVAWTTIVEGKSIAGPVELSGEVRGPTDPMQFAVTHLLVNDRVLETQYGPKPRFEIHPDQLRPAVSNRLQLQSIDAGGLHNASVVQHVFRSSLASGPTTPAYCFGVHHPAWDGAFAQQIEKDAAGLPTDVAAWYSNAEATLRVPDRFRGDCDLFVEARGSYFKGFPVLDLFLIQAGATNRVGQVRPEGQLRTYRVGALNITGPAHVLITYTNDAYESPNKDRNVFLRGLVLRPTPREESASPVVRIRYPVSGELCRGADAVVAEWAAAEGPYTAQVMLDGLPVGLPSEMKACISPVVTPLGLRGIPKGKHALGLAIQDGSGRIVTSKTVNIRVETGAGAPTRYERALAILNRFAYGPEPDALGAILTEGERPWLERLLRADALTAAELAVTERARRLMPDDYNPDQVIRRTLLEAISSPNPVRTRFVLWVENHFSTWIQKTQAYPKAREHEEFRRLGVAPFSELLFASASSPAMLVYLDQTRSYANRLNENYAREVMELHCLGVDAGYAQQDVTELARLLTGWGATEEAQVDGQPRDKERPFRFVPDLNTTNSAAVFGSLYPAVPPERRYDRVRRALDTLAAHPATARFVVSALAEHYVASPPPVALVDDLAKVYHATGGDLVEVLLAMAAHPDFMKEALRGRPVTPQDFGIHMARTTGTDNTGSLNGFMRRSGMGLYERTSPDGYPDTDEAFNDSNVVLQRWRLARDMKDALVGLVPLSARAPAVKGAWDVWQDAVVNHLALRWTGHQLDPAAEVALKDLLAALPSDAAPRLALMATFVAQEAQGALR